MKSSWWFLFHNYSLYFFLFFSFSFFIYFSWLPPPHPRPWNKWLKYLFFVVDIHNIVKVHYLQCLSYISNCVEVIIFHHFHHIYPYTMLITIFSTCQIVLLWYVQISYSYIRNVWLVWWIIKINQYTRHAGSPLIVSILLPRSLPGVHSV